MLYSIQGLSAGFFVSASRFLHVAGVLLVLLPSVLDHGASHRQKTGSGGGVLPEPVQVA